MSTQYETILVDRHNKVLQITLNRPEAMNAINSVLSKEVIEVCLNADQDEAIGCIVITGNNKVFAAGADIKEMQSKAYAEVVEHNFMAEWQAVANIRTPIIAAVAGYALGGGCELAMLCDFILCADNAQFGQPEIKLGVTPGIGGSQRLTKVVGKSTAMEMCLTGRMMDAQEAKQSGLVSRVLPVDALLSDALETAATIADFSRPVVRANKHAVKRAQELPLSEGLLVERQLFHACFALEDQTEGMSAFVEKRAPNFKNC